MENFIMIDKQGGWKKRGWWNFCSKQKNGWVEIFISLTNSELYQLFHDYVRFLRILSILAGVGGKFF